jgi:hypothetical protein
MLFRTAALLAALVCPLLPVPAQHQDQDLDRDQLPDSFEQALLQRFIPRFLLASGECDALPAEFQPRLRDVRVLARNGTIYGQVFPVAPQGRAGAFIELHFYHLWATDCGRFGHPLDAEHVSALLQAPRPDSPPESWTAAYWFAGAHESTVCDASNAAPASALNAGDGGPTVWISRGKHASYLDRGFCKWGCGGDVCDGRTPLRVFQVINIGEPGVPMNGAAWVDSPAWRMAAKMKTDFSPAVLDQLAKPHLARVGAPGATMKTTQAVILGGDSTADGLSTASQHTNSALNTASDHTDNALEKTAYAVDRSLRKAFRGVGSFLGMRPK